MLGTAPVFQAVGFETLTVDYRRGEQGIEDVQGMYRTARRLVGPRLAICALGVSAGGHIALMLAVREPDLACVIDLAGPTDLAAFRTDPRGAVGYQIVTRAFGKHTLGGLSPALRAGAIRARLLLVYALDDPLVPVAQGEEMARADPHARLILLPPGNAPFVHTGVGAPVSVSGVNASANTAAQQAEVDFLSAAAQGRGGG